MDGFDQKLKDATTAIASEFFQLPIHESPAIYRERVYCYELYHQLRLRWPANTKYRLNGDVDKRSHPAFADIGAKAPKPDLIIHIPGTADNFAVIEVKTADGLDYDGLRKDMKTLLRFLDLLSYQRGIHLVFGTSAQTTIAMLKQLGEEEALARIEFWGHAASGAAAQREEVPK